MAELCRLGLAPSTLRVPLPGMVEATLAAPASLDALAQWDPAYALQVLPDLQAATGESIADLARACAVLQPPAWLQWPGRFAVHVVVPGQLKGQPKPALRTRADLLQAALHKLLMAGAPKRPASDGTRRLVQVMLLTSTEALVSYAPLLPMGGAMTWPSLLPAGLADPPDDDTAPNSAFRKLREALAWLGNPPPGSRVVDLGASPGGWTHVLRQLDCQVTAIDRAPLAAHLMADAGVQYLRGDAFAWLPDAPVDGLVSDVIAYPQRVTEILDAWCGGALMRWFVVQIKFKGPPDWAALDNARAAAQNRGYLVRARHFFNDKNELTLIGVRDQSRVAAGGEVPVEVGNG